MSLSLNQKKQNTLKDAIAKPEINLLLCCSRTKLDDSIKKQINILVQQDLNWDYLISLASKHGVLPLLFNSLNNTCQEVIPKEILSKLRCYFQGNVQRNLLLTSQLLKIIEIFEANDIKAIPFKGSILTASVYGNIAFRQFCDLDVLIQQEQTQKAIKILVALGFNLPKTIEDNTIVDKPYVNNSRFLESSQYQGSYDLYNPDTKVAFEMHWSLTNKAFPFPPSFDFLWQNTQPIVLAGKKVPQFKPEILLIYLCTHASKSSHTWSELKWVCDLAELIQSYPDLDWQEVTRLAKLWGCNRVVNIGLLLTHKLLNLELQEDTYQKVNQDEVAKKLSDRVVARIFGQNLTEIEEYFFVINSRERLQDKISCFNNFVFVPTANEWDYVNLPMSLSFLYYLIRPYLLIKKYSSSW